MQGADSLGAEAAAKHMLALVTDVVSATTAALWTTLCRVHGDFVAAHPENVVTLLQVHTSHSISCSVAFC